MNHSKKTFLFLALITFPIFNHSVLAEQTMDSADALSVAQVTASDRCQKGKFVEALAAEQNALQIAENRNGPTHPSLIPILADLAVLDRHLALYPAAESNLLWALAIAQKNFGVQDGRVAGPLRQLSSLYLDWGHWEEAEFYQKKVLATGHSLASFRDLALLGEIEKGLQKKDEALPLLKESSEKSQRDPSAQPAELISSFDRLALAYQTLGKSAEEESCLQKALELARNSFKANSIEVADAMEHLAGFYRSQKRVQDAEPLEDSALKIDQGCVGTYFGYSSLPYVQKLAKADERAGLWKDAEGLFQKALQASKETYGANHPRVAVALLDLAGAEEGLGQKEAAQANLKKALETAKLFYRDDYPLVVQIQKELHP